MEIPKTLGKYPVLGVLGKGAMGVVYRAYDPLIRRPVAIKTILKELFDGELGAEQIAIRFRKEAQAAGALNHPGIVGVYEYGETEDYAYIAMEYVDGTSLREYFNRATLFPENDLISIMAQLLDALEHAHDHSVVHRDVKPANIIIMNNGRVKLADFGIARLEGTDRTQTSLVMGTPGYIAPEYYLNQTIDHRVDIFAAGTVFYELLSGQVPFGGTPEGVMHAVCYTDPAPPSSLGTERHWLQYDAVVARALQKRAEDRFPSAGAFRTALLQEYHHPPPEKVLTTIVYPRAEEPAVAQPPTPPPTGWEVEVLAAIKTELTRIVGPVARILVQRAAREHKRLEGLVMSLAEKIESQQERERFVRRMLAHGTTGGASPPATAPSPGSVPEPAAAGTDPSALAGDRPATPAEVEELVRLLSRHIGPIARVLVKRIRTASASRSELVMKAALAIDSEGAREHFMKEAGLQR